MSPQSFVDHKQSSGMDSYSPYETNTGGSVCECREINLSDTRGEENKNYNVPFFVAHEMERSLSVMPRRNMEPA